MPGSRLFIRIFLWFWVASVALLLTFVATAGSYRPAWGVASRTLLPYAGAKAAQAWESGHEQELIAYLDDLERRTELKAYLVGASANVPEEARAIAGHEFTMRRTRYGVWLVSPARGPSGAAYSFVALVPWRLFTVTEEPLWIPLLSMFVMAGAVCYLLARRLARPATVLRRAARQYAAGDLSARVTDTNVLRHGDEFGELAGEFNAMADQIEKAMENQRRLIGDLSHELGSPLARLRLAVGLARKQLGASAEAPLDRIEREAERLDALTQQVLDLVRAEARSAAAVRKQIRVDELLRGLANDAELEASAKQCHVLIDGVSECEVEADAEMLRSALDNVLRNAVKYTAERTCVELECRGEAGRIRITVRDRGPGVPDDSLPHLFEPFYRVNQARDRKSGGAGLGLSIARHAIEKHGGTIRAINRGGGGLQVEIELPAAIDKTLHFRTS
jgi:two-component system sensor histidine kinase CpxA